MNRRCCKLERKSLLTGCRPWFLICRSQLRIWVGKWQSWVHFFHGLPYLFRSFVGHILKHTTKAARSLKFMHHIAFQNFPHYVEACVVEPGLIWRRTYYWPLQNFLIAPGYTTAQTLSCRGTDYVIKYVGWTGRRKDGEFVLFFSPGKRNAGDLWEAYVYWTVHHLDSWVKRNQLDAACFIITLFSAQHASDVNTFILRSLRLIRKVTSWVVSGSMCVGVPLQCGYGGVVFVCSLKHYSLLHTNTAPL